MTTTSAPPKAGARVHVQRFGTFLSGFFYLYELVAALLSED